MAEGDEDKERYVRHSLLDGRILDIPYSSLDQRIEFMRGQR